MSNKGTKYKSNIVSKRKSFCMSLCSPRKRKRLDWSFHNLQESVTLVPEAKTENMNFKTRGEKIILITYPI